MHVSFGRRTQVCEDVYPDPEWEASHRRTGDEDLYNVLSAEGSEADLSRGGMGREVVEVAGCANPAPSSGFERSEGELGAATSPLHRQHHALHRAPRFYPGLGP